MQEIICEKFESGIIPDEWFVEAKKQSFEQNCYRTHEMTWFIIPLPKYEWKQIRVEIKAKSLHAKSIECSIDDDPFHPSFKGTGRPGFESVNVLQDLDEPIVQHIFSILDIATIPEANTQ